jgi:hypothetical protein
MTFLPDDDHGIVLADGVLGIKSPLVGKLKRQRNLKVAATSFLYSKALRF